MITDWQILLQNPAWEGWKSLIICYACERKDAEEEAARALRYYEGSTDWKVEPAVGLLIASE